MAAGCPSGSIFITGIPGGITVGYRQDVLPLARAARALHAQRD
jgi:hypothetical protein